MKRVKLNIDTSSTQRRQRGALSLSVNLIMLVAIGVIVFVSAMCEAGSASAHDGHNEATAETVNSNFISGQSPNNQSAAAVRTAERNITSPAGALRAQLRQSPPDPRTGEAVEFEVKFTEKIEGGFGGSGGQPIAGAITARVTTATGATGAAGAAGNAVAANLEAHTPSHTSAHTEGQAPRPSVYPGVSNVHYSFADSGNYKIIFDIRTEDDRQFTIDFPVTIVRAPINWVFWLGFAALTLLSTGTVFGYHRSWTGYGVSGIAATRKTLPVAAGALAFFVIGTSALAYFESPRERRSKRTVAAALLPSAATAESGAAQAATDDSALSGSGASLTIPKESQLLFNIRTVPIEERQIVSGLSTTGTVRARPNAQAVIASPVSGRVTLSGNITVGAAVGRAQTLGSVEQILGAPEQASLEAQRIQLRRLALEQQAGRSEQQALAGQARVRSEQAKRELQRATNLLEVGAAPRRRVEEAQTAVRLAEQEVRAAEQQTQVAEQQAQLALGSVARVDPVRSFPLTAPVAGVITNLQAASGQQVEAGAELMNVINLSTVFIEAQIFERDLAAVRESRQATYTAPALGGEVHRIGKGGERRLVSIGQSVDPQTRTVPIIFEVPNRMKRLREGMFVEITLDTSGGAKVVTVPKQSVITDQGRTFAFVFRGGEIYERRVVVLGAEGQDYYEVKSGLQIGERVVTQGIYQLRSTQSGT